MSTILVCSEERHILRLVQVNLERQGHTVHLESAPWRVIERLKSERCNFLVFDGKISNPTPEAMKAKIKEDSEVHQIQVLILERNHSWPTWPNSNLPPFA